MVKDARRLQGGESAGRRAPAPTANPSQTGAVVRLSRDDAIKSAGGWQPSRFLPLPNFSERNL